MFARVVAGSIVATMIGAMDNREVATASIAITSLPAYGTNGAMQGTVSGVDDCSAFRVAPYIYIEGAGWWTKPTEDTRTVPVDANCTFTANVTTGGLDHLATIFCAALVAAGDPPPPLALGTARVPAGLNSYAIAFAERFGRTITFAGRTWAVKSAPLPVGPGSNRFSADPADVWVDEAGLHLTIHQHDGNWWSTEVVLLDHLGYGTYAFETASRNDTLDPNVTFGMFTWDDYGDDESSGGSHQREIDFEDSRWTVPSDPNTQAVVQPHDVSGNRRRYNLPDLSSAHALTRYFVWRPGSIRFVALTGHRWPTSYPPASVIDDWTYTHNPVAVHYVPPPGRESVHLNLWVFQSPPANGQPVEVVVSNFTFTGGPFTDDPLLPASSIIRAVHVNELRTRVDALRERFGLLSFAWGEGITAAQTTVQAQHVNDLRTALSQAYVAAARTPPSWSEPIAAGNTVAAVHVAELRTAVVVLESVPY